MAEIVYVKEYQPSSATLKIGGDPIYRESRENELIRVLAPVAPNFLLIVLLGGFAAWLVMTE